MESINCVLLFPDYIKQCEIISHVTHQNAECTFKGPLVNSLPMNAGDNGKFSVPNPVATKLL